jgi:hypothetical protein
MQLGVQNAQLQQQLLPSEAGSGTAIFDFVLLLLVVVAVCYVLLCLRCFQAANGILLQLQIVIEVGCGLFLHGISGFGLFWVMG